jgi:putative drug exporter of the RND superfamily
MSSAPESPQARSGALARLGDLAYRRRGRMVLGWIALLAAVLALTPAIAGEFDADFETAGSESAAAATLLEDRFADSSSETIDVVWKAESGAGTGAARSTVDRFLNDASELEGIGEAEPPRISEDGTVGLARLQLTERAWDVPTSTGEELIDRAEEASGEGLRIELGGNPIQDAQEGGSPEGAGFLAAAIILLVAFGSIVAAGLPLAIALVGLGISSALIGVVAALIDTPDFAPAVAGLIGIGVGIDYALLVLTRFRTALDGGADTRASIVEAVSTAGRSVLIAGGTVVISVLGLFLMGTSFLGGVAVSASVAVLVVMASAVTLLPALLGFLGPRVNRLRLPGLGRALHPGRQATAARWSTMIQRRPWTAAIAGAAILLALTAPILGLRLGFPDAGNDREGTTTRAAYELVSDGFGAGANGPVTVAAELPSPRAAAAELDGLSARLDDDPNVAFTTEPRLNQAGDAAVITVIPRTSPQDTATQDLIERMRDGVVPSALAGTAIEANVGGQTAAFIDQSDATAPRLPLFIAGVVGLSFLLLLAAFRAPVIALKAGVMNLLSVGAAYGVVAAVAEGGFVGELIGISANTPVPVFIPVMMFAVLFGLSMDYEVFLLSRIREEYAATGETSGAVVDGLAKTARVITAAAAIMVVVFTAFVLSPESFLKLMGIGMASAILVDATVVRMVLVPAVMQLMGRANWWLPRWLDTVLPRFDLEAKRGAAAKARA